MNIRSDVIVSVRTAYALPRDGSPGPGGYMGHFSHPVELPPL